MSRFKSILSVILCFAITLPVFAQTPEIKGSSNRFFSRFAKDYLPTPVPRINFEDSARIDRLMRAGRIYLSLRDAIALALENNLDIETARLNPKLQQANLQRASAGALLRNVSNSISTGPSSASLGVLAGANALGSTGASSSSSTGGVLSGLSVQLAGSAIPNLDPTVFVNAQYQHQTSPLTSTFTTGTNFLVTSYTNANFGIQQGFLTGTQVTLGMGNTLGYRQNSPNNDFNPVDQGALSFSITQNLLNGFGLAVNNRAIRIAKNQLHISDLTFKQQVIATVNNVVSLYWDLVSFNDSLKVKQQTLELNRQLYVDNKRRAELGALAEIDIVQAEAEMKSSQQDVVSQETQVLQQEMILKSVITRSGFNNAGGGRRAHRPHRSLRCARAGCHPAHPGHGRRSLSEAPRNRAKPDRSGRCPHQHAGYQEQPAAHAQRLRSTSPTAVWPAVPTTCRCRSFRRRRARFWVTGSARTPM